MKEVVHELFSEEQVNEIDLVLNLVTAKCGGPYP